MTLGNFRDDHPRVCIALPGKSSRVEVEFIVDTGFAGDLALPARLVNQLEGILIALQERRLASGQLLVCPAYQIMLDWDGQARPTEILVMEGDPLLGTTLLKDTLLQVEMTEGGEVSVEPL